jgi:hypothetical protein
MDFQKNVLVVSGTSLLYCGLFALNHYLFSALSFSVGADWIFLPSGVRLFAILLFVEWGALGVILGAAGLVLSQAASVTDPVTLMGAVCLSGLAPLLARQICLGAAELKPDLSGLTSVALMRAAAIFAAISAGLHQLWFAWRGISDDIVGGLVAMFTGDVLGTLIVLYAAKAALSMGVRIRGG